jgi:hypothetical protein
MFIIVAGCGATTGGLKELLIFQGRIELWTLAGFVFVVATVGTGGCVIHTVYSNKRSVGIA